MPIDLITLAEYKAYAGINSTTYDAEITSLIPKVSALAKKYCNTTFVDYFTVPYVQYSNGNVPNILLQEGPDQVVSSVEYSSDFGQTYSPLAEYVDWVLDEESIYSTAPDGFAKRLRGFKITYTAGYATIPEALKLAIIDLVTYYRKNDGAVHSPKAPGTNSVQIEYISNTTLPAHIRRVLDLYKLDYT